MSTPTDSTIVNRPEKDRSTAAKYAVAIAALAAAVLIRYLLDPWMGNTLPLVTLFGAVATAVWTGGVRPAVAVVILGYLACSYLFIEPRGRIEFTDPGTLIGVLAYVFTCALIILFGEAAHRAQRRVGRDQFDQLLTARLLASIIESSDDAIISKSLNGIIQSWNAAAQRLFGYTADQAIGRHISLIIPPERIAEEDHIVSQLKAGKRIDHFETERVRSDGGRILVSLTISPIRDDAGTVIGASKIARDVTRQREAEHRERQLLAEATAANAKFHAFFEQGALFAGIMDVNGTLLEANRLSLEACGFTREQVIGKPFWEGPWWSPSQPLVDQIRAASSEAAAGQTFRAEMPYFVGDGSERIADVTIQPIRDESGRVLFLSPTGIDITDRRRVEAEREKLV
ncbi:MAG TPA: PAS domain S-box protein, partial [Vicinamibacterales bacterium]|nr:PAS domain S-box protein [Vicinamibacterales bacterium]